MVQRPLPHSLDDLHGLRAARWVRESTDEQFDRYGPDSQREQMDRFAKRFGLIDTGLSWEVPESGRTVWRHPTMAEMLAAARAGKFDVLLTGYADRWQRNLRRFLELIEDALHPAGVALVMCDRRLLSSDPHDWDEMVREAHGAEIYSRRLGERIADGYEARYRRYADPAGNAPSGFRRQPEPPHLLEIDPEAIGRIVEMFEKYSRGDMSFERLGSEYGIPAEGARKIIMNPIYNGWAVRASRRHGRGRPEERVPARWRGNPPVSDELWERAMEVRRQHSRGGGPRRHEKFDPLAGLIFCKCGRYLRADGFDGSGRHRRQHPDPCPPWGERRRYTTDTWYRPLMAQVGSLRLDNATIERVVRALKATSSRPDELRRKRIERRRRDLALDHAAGRVGDAEYMAAVAALRAAENEAPAPRRAVDAATAVRRLRDFGALWASRTEAQRAEMLREVYARIEVRGPEFIAAHLTTDAAELGLTVALPETVSVAMASPAGFEPATRCLEGSRSGPLSYGDTAPERIAAAIG
jgi:hypothetical protein